MNSKDLQTDKNGHLLDWTQWTQTLGEQMAREDGFVLSDDHWKIIHLVRQIYSVTESTPPMRLLIKSIRKELGEKLASSRVLYQLFPDGPLKHACKYGGLPKPKHCL